MYILANMFFIKREIMKRILLLGVVLSITFLANAQIESAKSGNWNNVDTWVGGTIPDADEAEIVAPHKVTLTTNVSCVGILINTGAEFDLSTFTLTLEEYLENDGGTLNSPNGAVFFDGSTRTMELIGVNTFSTLKLTNTKSTGKLVVDGNVTILDSIVLVDGKFNPNGELTLKATATKTARLAAVNANASVESEITYQTYYDNTNTDQSWRYFTFPGSDVHPDAVQSAGFYMRGGAVTNPSASVPAFNVGNYEGLRFYQENGQTFENKTNSNFTTGQGYFVYDYKNLSQSIYSITAIPVVGSQSLPVTFNSTGEPDDDGWNLVGNPFMSAIDWDNVTKSNIENAIYYNDNATGTTVVKSFVGGVGTPGTVTSKIAMSQAFWVHATAASPSVTVPESAKANISSTKLYKIAPIQNLLRIKIADADGVSDETVIRFKDGTTNDFDTKYDAYQRPQSQVTISSDYSVSELDEEKMSLVINSLEYIGEDTIPLVLENLKEGNYTINIIENSLFDEAAIVNLDTEEEVNVTDLSNYTIAVANGEESIRNRYAIVTKQREAPKDENNDDPVSSVSLKESVMELAIYPNPAVDEQVTLRYAKLKLGKATVQLIDMMGNILTTENVTINSTSGSLNLPLSTVSNGVYHIVLVQGEQRVAHKLVINKK